MSLFGTSGIRGDPEILFTDQFCFDIGRSFSVFLQNQHKEGGVAIGMDPRGSSPRILEGIESGLIFAKREVFDQGTTPIPAINYVLKTSSYAGGIMVSGSHIGAKLNGIKFFLADGEILKKDEEEIEKIYLSIKNEVSFQKNLKLVAEDNKANQDYEEMLVSLIKMPLPKFKIVVDPGNGAQSDIIARVLLRLGQEIKLINDNPQEGFIARDTEVEDSLRDLQAEVIKNRADMGIAFDADGDRVVFIDEKGKFVPGDYSGALIAKEIPGIDVVTPINTSQVVEYIGKRIFRTKVGSPFVVEKMKEIQAAFGFEGNGGGISAEIMLSRDGGSTMIKMLEIIKNKNKSLSNILSGELPSFYLYKTKVDCPFDKADEIIIEAKKQIKGIKTEELDGLKIWMSNDSWILFRSSKNAPEFRVFAESTSQTDAENLAKNGIELVKKLI